MTTGRFIIVTRASRAQAIRRAFASESLARYRMAEVGEDYDAYGLEEKKVAEAVRRIRMVTEELGPTLELERTLLPGTPLLEHDTILTIGQDGLVANTLKYAGRRPVLGINPDPEAYEGTLLAFSPETACQFLLGKQEGFQIKELTLAVCQLSSGVTLRAANDIFVGRRDHASALYRIGHKGREEDQSSSGIIVSTAMGASGWQRSILQGMNETRAALDHGAKRLQWKRFGWEHPSLRFWVREPWPSVRTQATLTTGKVGGTSPLEVISAMGKGGCIFSDGMQEDAVDFPAGVRAEIGPAKEKARLWAGKGT
jgi:NAD kinase